MKHLLQDISYTIIIIIIIIIMAVPRSGYLEKKLKALAGRQTVSSHSIN